ncbi:hypothetical protein TWF281_005266 [Arthrobotrys megalospora]
MHSRNILFAAFSLTGTALPIINPSAASVEPRGLLDGILGPGGLLGGLLGGITGGGAGDAVGGVTDGLGLGGATGNLPVVGGLTGGLDLDGLLGGLLSPDDGLLGSLLGGLGVSGESGLIGGLLGGLLGGGKPKVPGLDPSKQKVKAGTVQIARPQDGFTFQNIEVFSPKVGLLDLVLQLLLGGKKTMWLTRAPNGSSVKSVSGATFKVNPTSVKAVCFANDITTTTKWLPTACTMTILGLTQGELIGALQPQTIKIAKRGVTTTASATASANRTIVGLEELEGVATVEEFEVDEIRMAFTPPTVKEGGKAGSPINSDAIFKKTNGIPESAINLHPDRGMASKVYHLPDTNTVLKVGPLVKQNEAEALRLLRSTTSIPVPQVHEFYEKNDMGFLRMSKIEGTSLANIWGKLPQEQKDKLISQLRGYIQQWQGLTSDYFGAISGRPCEDGFFTHWSPSSKKILKYGPFASRREYNAGLVEALSNSRPTGVTDIFPEDLAQRISALQGEEKVFSHGDIHPGNILIDDDAVITGIVDWEMASFSTKDRDYFEARHRARDESWAAAIDSCFSEDNKVNYELLKELKRTLIIYCGF